MKIKLLDFTKKGIKEAEIPVEQPPGLITFQGKVYDLWDGSLTENWYSYMLLNQTLYELKE